MSIIKNHLQIELSIDQILYRLRLLRLNELQTHTLSSQGQLLSIANGGDGTIAHKRSRKRPGLETRSASQLNVILRPMVTIDEMEEQPRKRTEIIDPETMQDLLLISNKNTTELVVKSSRSTPMVVALSDNIQLEQNINDIKKIKKEKKQQLKEMRRERSSTKRGLLMTKPE